ncbi:cell division site-positioning protein MapZ family protein [Streptococcus ovuberis]|uniref:Holliday junction resolvase n=1 Tax=Streptococcus ovuberis TaxID=1936207 RepID=A0A7X6S047_9STRE|nr:cell division site-positioning protein MapZ family protein [Streptococcus ovuberis]NKZ19833.1 Holliday junction resolvase [Streptococcus ovuberis]
MSDIKEQNPLEPGERVLDLEQAKEMTVEEAAKTQEEIQAGITETDGVLDRYIKQHRDQIEASKFETKQLRKAEMAALAVAAEKRAADEARLAEQKAAQEAVSEAAFHDYDPEDDQAEFEEEKAEKRKKVIGLALAALALLGIAGTAYSQREALGGLFGGSASSTSTSTTASSSQTRASSSENPGLKAFEDLYASFFTDEKQTALKNESFGQLQSLETALSILEGTDAYDAAKAKVDKLKAAIAATEALNAQFDKPVLVDGEIDTTATAKSEADFSAASTGLSSVDAALTAAANFGRSQQQTGVAQESPAPSDPGTAPAVEAPAQPAPSAGPATTASLSNGVVLDYNKRIVYGSDQVNLQRNLSRVPYNDEVIADAANEAWIFAPNVLENIIATSNQRGYFAGNDFILEKVNIINGRGYYNMFKSDGTYLFSINAKTGYFVGNGSGYADALDF